MITGVVLARNEARHIAACLRSLKPHVGELILIDMESEDETVALARPFVDKVLTAPKTPNFDAARNLAIAEARYEWLWYLDADERVSEQTARQVRALIESQGRELAAIWIPFKTHFCKKWIEHCGWWPGYTMPRVLRRGAFRFSERLHGGVDVQGQQIYLPPDPNLGIEHYSYDSVEHYLTKFNRYTSTESQQFRNSGETLDWETGLREMVRDWHQYYENGQGVFDGIHGWILSWLAGQYRWFARAKLLDTATPEEIARVQPPVSLDAAMRVMEDELARRRAPQPQAPLGIAFHSPLRDPSGYAEDGRTLLRALASGPRALFAKEIPWSEQTFPLTNLEASLFKALAYARRPSHTIAITNCIATLVGPDPCASYNILRTTQETDRIPDGWRQRLEAFDVIWVLSQHNLRAFRQSGVPPEKLRVIEPGCDTGVFTPEGHKRPRSAGFEDRFLFLSIFDWQLRKGWEVLIRCYAKTFSVDEGAGLLLKITRQHGHSMESVRVQINQVLAEIGTSLDDRPDILLLEEFCDSQSLAALYRACDAFVLASRGEGWGRPYMEAMACGLPTIGTRGSGNDNFMLEEVAYLVEVERVAVCEAAAQEIPVFEGHYWNEPNVASLQSRMREVFQDRSRAKAVGRSASLWIRERFSLESLQERVHNAIDEIERQLVPSLPSTASPDALVVELEGEFFAGHSFSNINESLSQEWLDDAEIALTLTRRILQPMQDRISPSAKRLTPLLGRRLSREPDVLIRHAFPPNWNPPANASTKWVHIQPWEFGVLPVDWIHPLKYQVDEIWAPSEYVREVYLRSGISAEKVVTIPWGIDETIYHPEAPPLHLATTKSLKLLFVGGAIPRKGFDTLLEAYRQEFQREEDICLVIKDLGTQSFYRYGHSRDALAEVMNDPAAPEILYLDADFTEGQRASLYTACQVLVAPYRGEGFGLPVLEAMACGLVPVVPRGGATDDFTRSEFTEYIDAHLVATHHDWRLVGQATELEVDVSSLRQILRNLYNNHQELPARGRLASQFAHANYSWRNNILPQMNERLRRLHNDPSPPVRTRPPPVHLGARAVVPQRLPISVCLATCNDEVRIADGLARVAPFVEEILIADWGSTDATVAIAQEYGATVLRTPWEDSFSQVINFAVKQARTEWVFLLELGEYLSDADWKRIPGLLEAADPRTLGILFTETSSRLLAQKTPRLFRNDWRLELAYRAEPSVLPAIERIGGTILESGIALQRDPRNRPNPQRIELENRLLQLDAQEQRGDPHVLTTLGTRRVASGDFFHAECYLRDALNRISRQDERFEPLVRLLIDVYQAVGDPYRAREMAELISGANIPSQEGAVA